MSELLEILKFYREIGAEFLERMEFVEADVHEPGHVDTRAPEQAAEQRAEAQDPRLELDAVRQEIMGCFKCGLHKTKTHYVPGEGSSSPDIMFIGEGPGEVEDLQGRPFVGPAGQLLDKMIARMGYSRETVFIGNIVKCRPPGNRDPNKNEVEACKPYLVRQIRALKPKVIVCLGKVAMNNLLGVDYSIVKERGKQFEFMGIPVIPTFHPAYILRQQSRDAISKAKWDVWHDMEQVLALVNRSSS